MDTHMLYYCSMYNTFIIIDAITITVNVVYVFNVIIHYYPLLSRTLSFTFLEWTYHSFFFFFLLLCFLALRIFFHISMSYNLFK